MTELPEFINTLSLCKAAWAMGREEYGGHKFTKREFEGSLPKRKGGTQKILLKLANKERTSIGLWDSPARRMVLAAFDQGLLDEHYERERHESRAGKASENNEGGRPQLDPG